jgi:hypothetical protein
MKKIILPTIQIKDNFLTEKEFNIICSNLTKIPFQVSTNEEGNFGFRYDFEHNTENDWLFKKIKREFFPNIKLKKSQPCYHWRHNTHRVFSHVDKRTDYNFMLYLKGEELVYNGTGFYHQNNLNTYIGFVKNRALFFDGHNNVHTDLQALGKSSPRYTLNIFYKYEK